MHLKVKQLTSSEITCHYFKLRGTFNKASKTHFVYKYMNNKMNTETCTF